MSTKRFGLTGAKKICQVDECELAVLARGWCNKHYDWHRNRGLLDRGELMYHPERPKICSLDGCERKHVAKGYCSTHYEQQRRGEIPGEVRFSPGQHALRDSSGRKFCPGCESWRPEDNFHVDSKCLDGLARRCKSCISAYTKEHGYRQRIRRHSITKDRLDNLIASQGGRCGICGDVTTLFIDHDHNCCPTGGRSCGQCIRGMLCPLCNNLLGQARDKVETLQAAIVYLNSWAKLCSTFEVVE